MDPLPLGRCTEKNSSKQCNRWANRICLHCHQGVCLEHYDLHQNHIQIRIDRLNNQINDLRQILHTLTYQQIIENFQQKIDQWLEICKNDIDIKYKNMKEQLLNEIKQLNIDQFCAIQLKKIDQDIGKPLIDLFRIQNNNQLKQIESLEQKFQQIKTKIENIDSLIHITDEGQLKIDQLINSIKPIYQYSLNGCPNAMSGSPLYHEYLLIFQSKPKYSLIFIENTNKQIIETSINDFVYDICWSQSTQVFLLITEYSIYEYYPINHRLSQSYGNKNSSQILSSITCNLTDLYIIHKPDMIMYQRDIKKPFEKKNEWLKNDIMCEKDDQFINSIRIDEQKQILGLSIKQIDHQWRIDLFSIDNMQRLYHGSSFNISNQINSSFCMLTPLLNQKNQWLVQLNSKETSQIILLNEKAQIINKIDHNGFNLTFLGRDKIAFLSQIGIEIYQQESFV